MSDVIISTVKATEDQDLKETKETQASHPALVPSNPDSRSVFICGVLCNPAARHTGTFYTGPPGPPGPAGPAGPKGSAGEQMF